MKQNTATPPFVGDLSAADASVIADHARRSRSALEFGAGGSTQIIAQVMPPGARLVTVETEARWIDLTRGRLEKLGVAKRVDFVKHDGWQRALEAPRSRSFDFIFVDGAWPLRRTFALESWRLLKVGGYMLLHDTRRAKDAAIVAALLAVRFAEIQRIDVNMAAGVASNTTAILKKRTEPYINWQKAEGKPRWRYGQGIVPESFWINGR